MTQPGPKLEFLTATETDITVEFTPISNVQTYSLEYKVHQATWANAKSTSVTTKSNSKTKAMATDLEPGTTYCVRMACVDATGRSGEPGPEMVLDTEQVGCTPQQKSCCVVM